MNYSSHSLRITTINVLSNMEYVARSSDINICQVQWTNVRIVITGVA